MNVTYKNGKRQVRLLICEAELLQSAAFFVRGAGVNLPDEQGQALESAAEAMLQLVEDGTDEKQKVKLKERAARHGDVPVTPPPAERPVRQGATQQ